MHGNLPIVGYKFGEKAAYVTDVSFIPSESKKHLRNLDLLYLDATRKEPHPTHFHLERAIEVVSELRPKQAYLVHLSHDYDYDETNISLSAGIDLAYDGMQVEVED
jgi:phosphoribosyl 1,2-cyclic phosphate phosphodiesterase